MSESSNILEIYKAGRSMLKRFVYPNLTPEVLNNKVHPDSNSVGFLLRHIAEADYSFATSFLNNTETAGNKTIGASVENPNHFTNLDELLAFLDQSAAMFERAIENTNDWDAKVESRMGTLTRREGVGRNIAHTGYHAGQISLAIKYGKKY
jgi:uncharacterized damage-inducible protein DinB